MRPHLLLALRFAFAFGVLAACLAALPAAAQTLTVRGIVTDVAGAPLVGVNVSEAGTTNGTATDGDGRYALRYTNPDAIVVFRYIGFRPQEIPVDGRATLDVVLMEGIDLAELFVVGSRSYDRSVTDSPVAVDVLDVRALTDANGEVDLHQLLQFAAPAFNANRQSGADGSDHVDPASLRGLGPDQTLVLINGQRRHQSALINIFGSRGRGNTGTDLNAIPAAAIERIEILRDGASAQYGSDAIAGVINIVLRDDVGVLDGSLGGGAHQASFRDDESFDGAEVHASTNYGIGLGRDGFANVTFDYLSKDKTNRPADPDELAIYRRQFGDAALQNAAVFLNLGVPVAENASVYAFGGLNYRDTDAYAWTRDPDSDRNIPAIYPDGFDPRILSAITDRSLSTGFRTQLHGWDLDVNNTYGANRFHYFVDGTLNASLLERSPTRFDAGGFELMQNTTGAGISRFFRDVLSGVNVAFGAEHRIERYSIFAGEEGSWRNYGIADSVDANGYVIQVDTLGRPGGAQGFPGFRPENELDETRTNVAGYVDTEFNLSPEFLVAVAARGEHYSDFGNTLTARIAARYAVTPEVAIRASASTGFRAPSLAQLYFNTTFTDFVGGVAVDKVIARNNSALTRALGIDPLREEQARNASLGFTAAMGAFTATVDGYYIAIDDRVVLTGAFGDDDPDIGDELQALGVGAAQFFTNALDTETYGLDVILSYSTTFGPNTFRAAYAGNFNHMELGEVRTSEQLEGREDIYFGPREAAFLLASAPPSKMNLTLDFLRGPVSTTLRLVHFGEITLVDWLDTDDVYEARLTTDLSVGYRFSPAVRVTVGGQNIFDVYPSQQDTETETGGMWDAVQMGFSGRYLFARMGFRL